MKLKSRRKGSPTRLLWLLTLVIMLCSCNVTRTITTQSTYKTDNEGNETVITSRTVETYDARKNLIPNY